MPFPLDFFLQGEGVILCFTWLTMNHIAIKAIPSPSPSVCRSCYTQRFTLNRYITMDQSIYTLSLIYTIHRQVNNDYWRAHTKCMPDKRILQCKYSYEIKECDRNPYFALKCIYLIFNPIDFHSISIKFCPQILRFNRASYTFQILRKYIKPSFLPSEVQSSLSRYRRCTSYLNKIANYAPATCPSSFRQKNRRQINL